MLWPEIQGFALATAHASPATFYCTFSAVQLLSHESCGHAMRVLRRNTMTKTKIVMWLFILAGLLWILAGIRDLFAPDFFSISGRTVSGGSIALDFAIGMVFLIIGSSQAVRTRRHIKKS
jgi:hypothetical protein